MKEKLQNLLNELHEGLVDREHTLKAALLTLLAGENLLLVGPPGTGKSMVARRIADCLADDVSGAEAGGHSNYFEYLLTKFSTPEEIFGPLSISELKADRFKRNTGGYLPSVKIAFLDEIFKASSSILNALLTILNERVYHNGAELQKVPLRSLIAASNELPTDQEELNALYDRFLVRVFVDYVSDKNRHLLIETTSDCSLSVVKKITVSELASIRDAADAVRIPPEIVQAVQRIWSLHREKFKDDRREVLSDRRLKKVILLMRVSAATNNRHEVDLSDVFLLKDCMWNHADNRATVRHLLMEVLQGFSRQVPCDAYQRSCDIERIKPNVRREGRLKGFKGSGTPDDPILIETASDLAALEQEDAGCKGYYFFQTEDLDCSDIKPWPRIKFEGHYNGNGKKIKSGSDKATFVFSNTHDSSFERMNLEGFGIASNGYDCTVKNSFSSHVLIDTAIGCKIERSKSPLIVKRADKTNITRCEAGQAIAYEVEVSHIADCVVSGEKKNISWYSRSNDKSLIANIYKSAVERCFITGAFARKDSYVDVVGAHIRVVNGKYVANNNLDESIVKSCALGEIVLARGVKLHQFVSKGVAKAENCIFVHKGAGNCFDGREVAKSLFKKRLLETQLGWNFESVWAWDDDNDRPTLRGVGGDDLQAFSSDAALSRKKATVDLLRQQIRANIWL